MSLSTPPSNAINALTPSQLNFLKALPKAELHAHLNGSIPTPILQQLAREHVPAEEDTGQTLSAIQSAVGRLQNGIVFDRTLEVFELFPAICALTSTKEALTRATDAVLAEFLEPKGGEEYPQATYLELRSTPKKTAAMTRLEYVETVLDAVEKYRPDQAALIVSLDRRMSKEMADECVEAAITLKERGRRIVGVDLCGDPTVSGYWPNISIQRLLSSRWAMWSSSRVTLRLSKPQGCALHSISPRCFSISPPADSLVLSISQTAENTSEDTSKLLSFKPDRLGHATFLNDEAKGFVLREKTAVEICLTSNLL